MCATSNHVTAMEEFPNISIVIPNYNGGATIGETLQSLIDQNYPGLEILVVDGGSTDNSIAVIKQYERHIAWWVSQKDHGQSDAINKGLARATGEIVNWLCSDDVLLPGALHAVAQHFLNPAQPDVVAGACRFVYRQNPARNRLEIPTASLAAIMPSCNPIPQPGCFFRRALLTRAPILEETLHYTMDLDLWMYFRQNGAQWHFIPDVLAEMRFSEGNKTSTGGLAITLELELIYRRYVEERIPLTYWHRRLRYPLERIRHYHRGPLFGFLLYYPYQCSIILLLSPFYGFARVRHMNWADFA